MCPRRPRYVVVVATEAPTMPAAALTAGWKAADRSLANRIAIEAASKSYWFQFVGLDGKVIGLDSFGVSAKAEEAYQALGIHTQGIIEAADSLLKSN